MPHAVQVAGIGFESKAALRRYTRALLVEAAPTPNIRTSHPGAFAFLHAVLGRHPGYPDAPPRCMSVHLDRSGNPRVKLVGVDLSRPISWKRAVAGP